MNVETIALGSRKSEFDHELVKVEVAHNLFDEMLKKNLGFVHKAFDEMNSSKIASVKEYHDSFIDVLNRLKHPQRSSLSYFIDGINEDIRCMVMLFKPQTIHETYCLAKLQEATLKARKPKELIRTSPITTKNRLEEEYPQELKQSVVSYAINLGFQAIIESDAHMIQLEDVGEAKNDNDIENLVCEDVEEKDIVAQVVIDSPKKIVSVLAGVKHYQITKVIGYFERNKQDMLWDTFEIQDLCLTLEVKKDNENGQKDLSLVGDTESIEEMEKINIEMLFKHKRMGKSSSVIIFAENLEWKPGLEFWLVE
nr:hypothetical protein [Tanacetum cinerariifolium]GFB41271.1 hypothetical protein [Tanacetum cinerariifolium]